MSPALPSLILRQNFTRIRIDIGLLELLKLTFSQILGFKFKWRRCESRSCEVPPFTSHAVWFELQWDVRRLNIHWKLWLLFADYDARRQQVQIKEEGESRSQGGMEGINPQIQLVIVNWANELKQPAAACCRGHYSMYYSTTPNLWLVRSFIRFIATGPAGVRAAWCCCCWDCIKVIARYDTSLVPQLQGTSDGALQCLKIKCIYDITIVTPLGRGNTDTITGKRKNNQHFPNRLQVAISAISASNSNSAINLAETYSPFCICWGRRCHWCTVTLCVLRLSEGNKSIRRRRPSKVAVYPPVLSRSFGKGHLSYILGCRSCVLKGAVTFSHRVMGSGLTVPAAIITGRG